jgi:hypothetical protein
MIGQKKSYSMSTRTHPIGLSKLKSYVVDPIRNNLRPHTEYTTGLKQGYNNPMSDRKEESRKYYLKNKEHIKAYQKRRRIESQT